MLAVIRTGGKQYLVKEGDILTVEKIDGKAQDEVVFSDILLATDDSGNETMVGTPVLSNIKVSAKILEQGRGEKIMVIKYKPKVRYRKKKGHHQLFTKVQITKIA